MEAGHSASPRALRARLNRAEDRISIEPLRRRIDHDARLAGLAQRGQQALTRRLDRLGAMDGAGRTPAVDTLAPADPGTRVCAGAGRTGKLVRRASEVVDGEAVTLRFADGDYNTMPFSDAPRQAKPTKKETPRSPGQGSLFQGLAVCSTP